uniref:chitin synthase n=1 Tax=Timema genevievae TaxID=629358 RepID=A0A7R9PM59_TIMGE|nr:unnamed protein product [Timema genevievae]
MPTSMEEDHGYDSMDSSGLSSPDHVITVYACATMWHETRTEMMGFVGSIEKLDKNNSNRNIDFDDGKYFNLEVHIFFDDAFTNTSNGPSFNLFVKNLVSVVEQTFGASVAPPRNIETPYGGRLEYSLPGHTAMLVHLKDRNRIRHGKRWSQVMYMSYLLTHRLNHSASKTFILTLDGDVSFSPVSVDHLVDVMRKDKRTGSVCGRLHASGSGEDRWMTTLLLMRGHRVKYTPSSIAYTQCPETFDELFNQRRRWIPSEFVNIVDLIINQFKCELGTNTRLNRFFTIYHLMSAKILSVMYGLLILSTMIVIAVDLFRYGLVGDLRSLFFVVVMHHLFFVVILYPLEVTHCKTILPFYVTSPSRLLLLPIFTVFNIQDVTWGTRETQVPNEMNERTSCNFVKVSEISLRTTWRKVVSNMKQIISNSYGDVLKFTETSSNPNFIERVPGSYCIEVGNTKSSDFMEHDDTQPGNTSFISDEESQFWSDIIGKYLHPIDDNKEKKMKVYNDLCRLRYIFASVSIIGNGFFIYLLAPKFGDMSSVVYDVGDKGGYIGTAVGLIPFVVSVVTLFFQICAVTTQRLVALFRYVTRRMNSRTSWRLYHV